jgi:HAD superfamily hydrolase (TIGR01549 family)
VDFGGTLDGDGIHWSHRFDRAFRHLGLEYTPEALQDCFRSSEQVMNTHPAVREMDLPRTIEFQCGLLLQALGFPGDEVRRSVADYLTAETREYLARNSQALRQLHTRARVGILSNFTGNLELIFREEGLTGLVDGIFDSTVVGLRKPDPAFFLHALDRIGGTPARSAMVGDSVDMDLRPARNLGLATVWVEGERPRQTDFDPDFTLRSISQLPGIWDPRP